MNLATLTVIVVGSVGALLAGMAGLLKVMVLSKLDRLDRKMDANEEKHHKLDLRVTRLETEHALHACCRLGGERTHPGVSDAH